jgi:hypothetical protein
MTSSPIDRILLALVKKPMITGVNATVVTDNKTMLWRLESIIPLAQITLRAFFGVNFL